MKRFPTVELKLALTLVHSPRTPTILSRLLNSPIQTVSKALTDMEKDGLVTHTEHVVDRRKHSYGLTTLGYRVLELVYLPHARYGPLETVREAFPNLKRIVWESMKHHVPLKKSPPTALRTVKRGLGSSLWLSAIETNMRDLESIGFSKTIEVSQLIQQGKIDLVIAEPKFLVRTIKAKELRPSNITIMGEIGPAPCTILQKGHGGRNVLYLEGTYHQKDLALEHKAKGWNLHPSESIQELIQTFASEEIPHITAIVRSPYDAILCSLPEVTVVKTDLTPQLLCVVNPEKEGSHVGKTRRTLGSALSTIVNPVWRYKEILQHLRLKQTQLDLKL